MGVKRVTDTAAAVLNATLVFGESTLTNVAVAQRTGKSVRAVNEHVKELLARGVLQRSGASLRLGPSAGLVGVIAIGDGAIDAAVVDANGDIVTRSRVEATHQLHDPPAAVMERAGDCLDRCLREAQPEEEQATRGKLPLLGVICTVPSAVDRDGIVRGHAFTDREWRSRTIAEHLRPALPEQCRDVQVDFMNNANADALAIAFDRARERALSPSRSNNHSEVVIAIRLGNGVGAGTVLLARHEDDGPFALTRSRLMVGTEGLAGEIGHLPVSRSDLSKINEGLPPGLAKVDAVACSCQKLDHLESFVASRAIWKRLGRTHDVSSHAQLQRLLEQPDDLVNRCLTDVGRIVARTLSSTILMLDPKSVTLSGDLGLDAVREGMWREKHRWSEGVSNEVQIYTLSPERRGDSTIRGAAIAVLRREVWAPEALARLAVPARNGELTPS